MDDEQRHIAVVVASEPFKTFVSERDFGNGPVAKTRIKSFKRSFERAGSYQKAIPPKIFRLICPSENRFVLFKSWYFIPSHKQNFCNGVFSMLLTLYPKKFLTVHYEAREHAMHAVRSLSFEKVDVIRTI